MWLRAVTLPLVGLGFLSLSWEILAAMYRWVTGLLGSPWASQLCSATPEGMIHAWGDVGSCWHAKPGGGLDPGPHGVGARLGCAG